MYLEPERREAMGAAARESAERYAWPRVAERVEAVYERALAARREPATDGERLVAPRRAASRSTAAARRPAQRLPSLDPAAGPGGARGKAARRAGARRRRRRSASG